MSQSQVQDLTARYDAAAPAWADKMRALGYHDAYLGFLADSGYRAPPGMKLIDIGAGTAGFAEAWVAIHGTDQDITLLDPSGRMLARGAARLSARGVTPTLVPAHLDDHRPAAAYDAALAAHVIEHGKGPKMLQAMRNLVRPGGHLWLVVSKPHWCNAIIWPKWRHQSHSPQSVRRMLAGSGWVILSEYAFPAGPPSRTSRGYFCKTA